MGIKYGPNHTRPLGLMILTIKCLSIRTLKTINFPFVSNGKLIDFRCPMFKHIIFWTPKNGKFSIWDKWKIN